MERWEAKVISLFGMFLVISICMTIPIKVSAVIQNYPLKALQTMSILRCFGGGVFLGTIFLVLISDMHETNHWLGMSSTDGHYPLTECICLMGFFGIAFLEKLFIELNAKSKTDQESQSRSLERSQEILTIEDFFRNQHYEFPTEDIIEDSRVDIKEEVHLHGSKRRSLVLLGALSIEAVFDGLAVGLQPTVMQVWNMFIAVASHESILAFCLGLELVNHYSTRRVLVFTVIYAAIPAVGCAIGLIITELDSAVPEQTVTALTGVLLSLAAGTFLYCTFTGMLGEELMSEATYAKLASTAAGCALMAGLAAVPKVLGGDDEPHPALTTMPSTI